MPVMLEPSYNDSRSNANPVGKGHDSLVGLIPVLQKSVQFIGRNEFVAGESVGLLFFFSIQAVALDENLLPPVF